MVALSYVTLTDIQRTAAGRLLIECEADGQLSFMPALVASRIAGALGLVGVVGMHNSRGNLPEPCRAMHLMHD